MRKIFIVMIIISFLAFGVVYLGTRSLHWNSTIDVYSTDSVSNNWKIEEAIYEWNKLDSALSVNGVSTSSEAEIVIYEAELDCEELNSGCITGIAFLPLQFGSFTVGKCFIILNSRVENEDVREHTAIHEIGHCLGLGHSMLDSSETIMNTSVSPKTIRDEPGPADETWIQHLYGVG